jgi:uncharacterized protein GlcG (DUF336 family)
VSAGVRLGRVNIRTTTSKVAPRFFGKPVARRCTGTDRSSGQCNSCQQFFGIHVSNHGRVMIFAGGLPLKSGGKVVGAVGVSGGTGEQDQQIVVAAAAAL